MAFTIKDSFTTGDNQMEDSVYGTQSWTGQVFTAGSSYTITRVGFKLRRTGSPGTVTMHVRGCDGGGNPTGADLASGTKNCDSITTSSAGEWVYFDLGAGTALTNATKYMIALSYSISSVTNCIGFRYPSDGGGVYTGGYACYSNNSGLSFSLVPTQDYVFETYTGSAMPKIIGATVSKIFGITPSKTMGI